MRPRTAAALLLALAALPVARGLGQDEDVAPGENLVTEGIPKIPAALVAAVASYTDFRSASLVSWHPSRREMLIATRFADTAQLHRVRAPLGARRQLTFFRDRVTHASYPRRRSDTFVFSRDVGGGEFYQNYRFDVATGAITLLTDGRSRNSIGPWSHEGDRLAFTSTRRNRRDTDLYVVDPADPRTERRIAEVNGTFGPSDWSPDDAKLLVEEFVSANESHLWLFDVATGARTELTRRGQEKVSWRGGKFSADGKSVFAATDAGAEFQRLARLDLETKELAVLTPGLAWDVESFDLSSDGKTIAFVANEDGVGVLHLLDCATGAERRVETPPGTVGSIAWREGTNELGFELASARSPEDVWSLDAKTGAIERWTESETGPIETSSFREPEVIRWKSGDGLSISGLLYRPSERFAGKRPVVISIHGGPEGQSRPGFMGRGSLFLNELGVALILPNVRGSSGYGKTFLKLDDGRKREDSVKDVGALLDWIAGREDLDKDRVMVTGGSYGGYMSLAVASTYPERIRCAVDAVGISNFVTFLERTEPYRRDLRRAEYGDERDPAMREFLLSISPLTRADRITKPLFVIQGKNDPRVPLAEAEQIVAAVRKNGTKVWYLMAKDEGHGFSKKKNSDFQLYATILFMQEHLLR